MGKCVSGNVFNLSFSKLVMENVPLQILIIFCQQRACVDTPEGEHWKVAGGDNLHSEWNIQPMSGSSLVPVFKNITVIESKKSKNQQ